MVDRELRYLLQKKVESKYLVKKGEDPFLSQTYTFEKPTIPDLYIIKKPKNDSNN